MTTKRKYTMLTVYVKALRWLPVLSIGVCMTSGCANTLSARYRDVASVESYNQGGVIVPLRPGRLLIYEVCELRNKGRRAEKAVFSLQKVFASIDRQCPPRYPVIGPDFFSSNYVQQVMFDYSRNSHGVR